MTLVFSLFGGLLVAIAIQLVFANLGIALGLTALDWSPSSQLVNDSSKEDITQSAAATPENPKATAKQSLPITHFLGFGVAVGFSTVIFIATLLSVEFSQLTEPRRGIVFGLFFWSTYWLLFIWLSSNTIAGIADSLLGSALEGGRQLVSTLRQAIKKPEKESEKEAPTQQLMLQELIAEISQLSEVRKELPTLLADQRETLLEEVCDRTNLSTEEAETIVSKLEPQSTEPEPIESKPRLPVTAPASTPSLTSQLNLPSWQQLLRQALNKVDLSSWDVETIWQLMPLEEHAHDKQHYQTAQLVDSPTAALPESSLHVNQLDNTTAVKRSPALQAIQDKLISYCRYTNIDSLTPEKLINKVMSLREEHGLLDDDDLDNMSLDIKEISSVLSRREKISSKDRAELIDALKTAWPAQQFEQKETTAAKIEKTPRSSHEENNKLSARDLLEKTYQAIESQVYAIDWSKTSLEDIKPEINILLEQLEKEQTLQSLDWQALTSRLQLPATARAEFVAMLQTAWNAKVQSLQPIAIHSVHQLSQQVAEQITHLLHYQEKSELTPDKIADKLTQVVTKTISSLPEPAELIDDDDLGSLLDQETWDSKLWNKEAWQETLEKRKDLTTEEIQRILAWGEQVWQPKAQQVSRWLQAAKAEVSEQLADLDLPQVDLSEANLLIEAREQVVGTIVAAQEKVSTRAIALKQDLQVQADAARRQVAIAAWWLFIALILSGSAAAEAGYLAAIY